MLTDSGRVQCNKIINGNLAPEGLIWGLYTTLIAWSHSTVLGDIVPAAWAGYAPVTIPLTDWNAPVADGSFDQVATSTLLAGFLNSSGVTQTAYGFFVIGATTGVLYGGAAFASPLPIANGQTVAAFPLLLTNAVPTSP